VRWPFDKQKGIGDAPELSFFLEESKQTAVLLNAKNTSADAVDFREQLVRRSITLSIAPPLLLLPLPLRSKVPRKLGYGSSTAWKLGTQQQT